MKFTLLVAVVVLAGCSPQDRESCVAAATKLPSETGVRVAISQCNDQFGPKLIPFNGTLDPPSAPASR